MRIVVITGEDFESPWQRYMLWLIHKHFGLAGIVTTHRRHRQGHVRRYVRLIQKRGLIPGLGEIVGIIPNTIFTRLVWSKVERHLLALTPMQPFKDVPVIDGGLLNSRQCVDTIRLLRPDVLYQCGAGIIKSVTFNAARGGMVNLHHGIIPQIRGCSSALWAVRQLRPDWLGVSAHMVDEGIDTGSLLAQGSPGIRKGQSLAQVLTQLQIFGGEVLMQAFEYLSQGRQAVPAPGGITSVYRSRLTIWDWLVLAVRRRRFLRMVRGSPKKLAVGAYLREDTLNHLVINKIYRNHHAVEDSVYQDGA